jgi:hypothetical protein
MDCQNTLEGEVEKESIGVEVEMLECLNVKMLK